MHSRPSSILSCQFLGQLEGQGRAGRYVACNRTWYLFFLWRCEELLGLAGLLATVCLICWVLLPYHGKRPLHVLGLELRALAAHVEKTISHRCIQHGFTHCTVVRVGNVEYGEAHLAVCSLERCKLLIKGDVRLKMQTREKQLISLIAMHALIPDIYSETSVRCLRRDYSCIRLLSLLSLF